jgi:hypothetical protein
MFGFFDKKTLENSSFNNMLIVALSETVGKSGRLPNEGELMQTMDGLLKTAKASLDKNQINAIRTYATAATMSSFSAELVPLLKQFKIEMPQGEINAFKKIASFLNKRGITYDQDALNFLK